MLEEVELELSPESGTGDDWSSLRKSKPPGWEEVSWSVLVRACTEIGGEHTEVCKYLNLLEKTFDFGYGYD